MMNTFGGKKHVVYKKYVYRHKKNVPESNISYWDCYKTKCKAKLMLKLAEKQVVGELKKHDHGPPTKVLEKGVWKNFGKNITKRDCAHARNNDNGKTKEMAAHTKLLTSKVKTVEVQTTEIRKTKLHTVEVQTMKIQTIKVNTVEVQTVGTLTVDVELQTIHVQTKESEVQTMAVKVTNAPTLVQNSEGQPEVMALGIDFNMFTEVAPTDTATIQLLENIPTESAALELPIPTVLASNRSVYYESPNGLQITGPPPPMEVLSTENKQLTQVTKKIKCTKHQHPSSFKRCHCKRDCCNKTHTPKNINVSPLCDLSAKTTPVTQFVPGFCPQQTAQPMTVANPTSVAQIKSASQPKTFAQPSSIVQTPKYVNLVCVQTDHGPQILALPQPALSSNTNQAFSPANVSQPRYQGNAAQHSPLLIDLTSPLASQPTILNQPDSSNIRPIFQPSTSVVIVSQPSISNIDLPVPIISQPSSLTVNRLPTFKVAQGSTTNVNQASSTAVNSSPLLLAQLSASMVSQFFTSLDDPVFPSTSKDNLGPLEIGQSSASVVVRSSSQVDQPLTATFAESSTLKLNESFSSEIVQSSSTDNKNPSTFEVEKQPTAEFKQKPKSEVKITPTSEVEEPATSKIEVPSTSKVDQLSTSVVELPSNSKVKQPFTSKHDQSSSDDYSPPEPIVKKPKVAKRISKPRKSKYRAELLLKTYISDYSDDD